MGGSSGGGSSGRTDYPEYMKTYHGRILDQSGTVYPSVSVVQAFNAAVAGNSPFYAYMTPVAGLKVVDGFIAGGKTLTSYAQVFELLKAYQEFDLSASYTANTADASVASITADISSTLDDDITNNILPKFHANLRGAGAVMSSAFAIGEAIIWDAKLKSLAAQRIDIEKLSLMKKDQGMKVAMMFMDFKKQTALATTDVVKTFVSLHTDEATHYAELADHDRKFDLEMYQYCNNTLASISGAALNMPQKKNQVGAAVGGMLSGAAAGAIMGSVVPGVGTMVGAIAGGVMGLAGGLFN